MFSVVYLHTCLFPSHPAGSDYTQVSGELVFIPASAGARKCVNIPIIQDELAEGSEVFQVNLGTQNLVYISFIGPIRTATVTVTDAPTEPTSDTDATEPPVIPTPTPTPSSDDGGDTDTTETTPTPTPTSDDGGGTTGGDIDTDDTTNTPSDDDGSNPDTPNTDSDPNDNGEGPDSNSNPSPDGTVSEDNSTPQTVGVADYGVIAKSLSPVLLLLAASLVLLL